MDRLENENENVKVIVIVKTTLAISDRELLNQAKDLVENIIK